MGIGRKVYIIAAVLILFLLLAAIVIAGNGLERTYSENDTELAEETVRRYAVQCYALEGAYPQSIEYLTEHYTLALNEDQYVYHYDFIGSNLMPEISVFPIE